MKKNIQKWIALAMVGTMSLSLAACALPMGQSSEQSTTTIQLTEVTKAKNVILMIGDGMGPTQIEAGALYKGEALTMEGFPYMTKVETRSANAGTTDSAAAATALATGTRTNNGMVGKSPTGEELTTIVDFAASLGKRTGVITTEEIYGATPMGFSGHADDRDSKSDLVKSAVASSNVNFFACDVLGEKYKNHFAEGGYETIALARTISDATSEKVFGSFNIEPTAEAMWADGSRVGFDRLVTEALEYLSQDEDGFFLMAEGAHIDHGGHQNNFTYMLEELISFDNAVKAVLDWAKDRDDTVVIVTADHETGGLMLSSDATHEDMLLAYQGEDVGYSWSTTSHTPTDVNLYVNGANIDFAQYSFGTADRIKNTDVFEIMKALMK
jgi:alkaline phosphatase